MADFPDQCHIMAVVFVAFCLRFHHSSFRRRSLASAQISHSCPHVCFSHSASSIQCLKQKDQEMNLTVGVSVGTFLTHGVNPTPSWVCRAWQPLPPASDNAMACASCGWSCPLQCIAVTFMLNLLCPTVRNTHSKSWARSREQGMALPRHP